MSELVTVIVPVYDVEEYVGECLTSIINQSYPNLEIIVTVSTSNDNSEKIVDEIAATDSRITVLKESALGLSHARNTAMEIMNGDYVVFVDSDDYLMPEYIETLLQLSRKSDGIAMCGYHEIDGNGYCTRDLSGGVERVTNGHDLCDHFFNFRDRAATAVVWNKMYRKDIVRDLTFPNGKIYEDEAVMYYLLYPRKEICMSPAPLYCYRFQRQGSITGADFSLKSLVSVDNHIARRNYFDKHGERELVVKADFMLFNDIGYYWVCLAKIVPSSHFENSRLRMLMLKYFWCVMTNLNSKWWMRPTAIAFLIEFAVWKAFLRVSNTCKHTVRVE